MENTLTMRVFLALVATLVSSVSSDAGQMASPPTLRVDAPASLAAVAQQVRRFPASHLTSAVALSGLVSTGPPIDVLLIAENSGLAQNTPPWISGFADAKRNMVVLFPSRARSYPSSSLETLLRHEVAHILFARAAGGQQLPRWFNEGLALAAERPAGLGDRSRLAWTLVRHGPVPLNELERLFGEGQAANQRAYAIASALVRELLRVHGETAAGQVLSLVGRGHTFSAAFEMVAGEPVQVAVSRFWNRQRLWGRWIPFLTGPAFLWMLITVLALYAIGIRQRRSAEQRRAWDEEEEAETRRSSGELPVSANPDPTDNSYNVH